MPTAPAADQHRLLKVQEIDSAVLHAQHRRGTLPVLAEIARLDAEAAAIDERVLVVTTEVGDIRREVTKAEDDVQSVRSRAERDSRRLNSGEGTPKDLQALQSELELLGRRQLDLEEIELEAMERLETGEGELAAAQAQLEAVTSARAEAIAARDAQLAEIAAELHRLAAERVAAVSGLDAGLVELYDKLRASHAGVGAAALAGGVCLGCHMGLNPTDLVAISRAEPDQVVRCEECGRILVRNAP